MEYLHSIQKTESFPGGMTELRDIKHLKLLNDLLVTIK